MSNSQWFALQTKTQYERVVGRALRAKGYEEFLPLFKRRTPYGGTIREIEEPLFPGYVFCRFDALYRLSVLQTPYVHSVVGFKDPVPVADQEIEALQMAATSGCPMRPWPFLEVGQRVRIEHGSMQGVEGLLLEIRDRYRIVVSVSLLQRSVAVEIDEAWLSVAGPAPRRNSDMGGSHRRHGRSARPGTPMTYRRFDKAHQMSQKASTSESK